MNSALSMAASRSGGNNHGDKHEAEEHGSVTSLLGCSTVRLGTQADYLGTAQAG